MTGLGAGRRVRGASVAAASLVVLDIALRVAIGAPYPGATVLLISACGVAVLPLFPAAMDINARVAALPAASLGIFSILLTSASIVDIPLTELSIRLVVAGFVLLSAIVVGVSGERSSEGRFELPPRLQAAVVVALLTVFSVSLASAVDVVRPFPPPGSDWGFYLLYADEVESQRHLLIDNPYAVGDTRPFGNYPGIGGVYGSLLILDDADTESLRFGIAVLSAVVPLSVYAAVATLWGAGAGLVAAAAMAVAPIRLELLHWHGLATTYALALLPLALLALGLVYRGVRDTRTAALLGLSLICVVAAHPASAPFVALLVGVVLVFEILRRLLAVRAKRGGGAPGPSTGVTSAVLKGVAIGCLVGAGVIVHFRLLARELGPPISYRFFDPGSFTLDTLVEYHSFAFLALAAASLAVVVLRRDRRRDGALPGIAAFATAGLLVTQLGLIHVAFDYRRAAYYLAVPLVALVGVAPWRFRPAWGAVTAWLLVLAFVAHTSIGLRLPQRLLDGPDRGSPDSGLLEAFARRLDRTDASAGVLLVTDSCLGARVPYFVRRPTLIGAAEWQVGFERLLPTAKTARTILAGGSDGRRAAARLGVDYAIVNPRCTPRIAGALGGRPIVTVEGLEIVALPGAR